MDLTPLATALTSVLGTERATSCDAASAGASSTPASSRRLHTYGPVDATDYEVLLRLTPVVNLWQHIGLAAVSWEAATPDAREQIDASVLKHLHTSLELYRQARERLLQQGIENQQSALEFDTAMSGQDEVARLLDQVPGRCEERTTRTVFDRINRRIDSLCKAFMRQSCFREIDWRMPAIASHLPVFHLEFGERHLELRCSVVGA